jgi:hypothetical protein
MKFEFIKAACLVLAMSASSLANSAVVLLVDLTVENQITVNATAGASLATVSGSDTTGFSLANFFDPSRGQVTNTLQSGNITSANNISDGSPIFFGSASGEEFFNIFGFTNDPFMTFTAGLLAFTGQATWTVDSASYLSALNGGLSGNVVAPFDNFFVTDLANASIIGTWEVIGASEVSEPSIIAFLAFGLIGLAVRRCKQQQSIARF